MAAALDSRDVGRVIRAYRCHPFHRQRLSQALVAGWLHMSQAAVCRIETGRRRVTIDEIAAIAHALGMPIALPWTLQLEVGEDVDPLSRRSLLGAGVGAALGLNATTAPIADRPVDPELASHWIRLLHVLDAHDAMCGPHDALASVRNEINLITQHRHIAKGELHRQLLRVEARWAQFASWLSNDVGDRQHRDAWLDQALRLAEEADYPEMVAYVLMRQSRWAVEDRDARRAIALARAAGRTPRATERVRALCALHEAQGHALAHDADSCERSVADADDLLDRAKAPPSPWDDLARNEVNAPAVLVADARCWLWLRPAKAIGMLDDAVRIWPRNRLRSRGIQQARLALACAAADEPERAAAEGIKALSIAHATKSDGIVRELRCLDRQLAVCDVPAAGDFHEAFRDAFAAL
jgi:transcriptional regulator with XRE-family HTH domain